MYVYEGLCPRTGERLTLPRTVEAESAARQLMGELGELEEGKMFGVLLVEGGLLRAFSGLWQGQSERAGWVPPIMPRRPGPLERQTLVRLEALKQELGQLLPHPSRARLASLLEVWEERRLEMNERHRRARAQREARRRELGSELEAERAELEAQSRAEGRERRALRACRESELATLQAEVAALEDRILACRQERKRLSRCLQAEMHAQFQLLPFQGEPWSLASLYPKGPPTGTGECCAPKLLHEACRLGLRPLAMAEFWWGPEGSGRRQGRFYAACRSRCGPLLGPLLAGLVRPLEILYADADLVAVVKPPGVLTVPGRRLWNRDCLLTRLAGRFGDLFPVHRLDLETSGVVVLARTPTAQAALQRQFAERRVDKVYEAILERAPVEIPGTAGLRVGAGQGCVEAPIARHGSVYRVDPAGRPARTSYRVLNGARVELCPHTGRSHQLRVHAAQVLGAPILGDPLYGTAGPRMFLHARRLDVYSPSSGRRLTFESPPDF